MRAEAGPSSSTAAAGRFWWIVGAETAVFLAVGAHRLGGRSLNTDEGFTAALLRLGAHPFWHTLATREANQGAYYVLLRMLDAVGLHVASTEGWLRATALVFGVATVPLVAVVGRRLRSATTGALAAGLLVVNGYAVFHARFARSYALVTFLVVLSMLCFLRLLDEPTRGRQAAWAVVGALAVYAHLCAVLVLLAEVALLLVLPEGRRRAGAVVQAGIVLVVLAAPFLAFLATTPGDQLDTLPRATLSTPFHFFSALAGEGGALLAAPVAIAALLGAAPLLRSIRARTLLPDDRGRAVVVVWLAVPFVTAVAVSAVHPFADASFLTGSLPALALLVALGIEELAGLDLRVAAVLAAALVALGIRSVVHAEHPNSDEDWRAATSALLAESRPGDALLVDYYDERAPLDYYVLRDDGAAAAPTPVLPPDRWGDLHPVTRAHPRQTTAALVAELSPYRRVWVLHRTTPGEPTRFPLPAAAFRRVAVRHDHLVDTYLYAHV